MRDTLYNIGYSLVWVIPVVIALVCIGRIRKNRAEIKRLEEEQKKSGK